MINYIHSTKKVVYHLFFLLNKGVAVADIET